jgi:peptide/nickel transport system ATP-binding protein
MTDVGKKGKRILSVRDLVVEYTSGSEIVQAVNGVSFDLNYGQTLGIVGETGAGKTTIAKSIMRILPMPPARIKGGEVYLEDVDLMQLSDQEMRGIRGKRISMIFQDPMTALNPVIRVGEQIAEVIRLHEKVSKKEADERAKQTLELVGISRDRFREYPHQFSGGMKQRVVIAIALACDPDLLIADEPTTALDVTIQAQVLELINSLQKKRNSAMILITHDFGVVAKCCDAVAVVYGGQIVEYGTKEQIFRSPRHPYTEGLFGAIPQISADVDRLEPIFGLPPDPTCLPQGCFFAPRCPYAVPACKEKPISACTDADGHICRCLRYADCSKDSSESTV